MPIEEVPEETSVVTLVIYCSVQPFCAPVVDEEDELDNIECVAQGLILEECLPGLLLLFEECSQLEEGLFLLL